MIVTKTPTGGFYFQPSCQVPFGFKLNNDEAWFTTPVPAEYILEIETDIFTGSITIDGIFVIVAAGDPFTPVSFVSVDGDPIATLTNLIGAITSYPKIMANWTWFITPTLLGASLTMRAKTATYIPSTFAVAIAGTTPVVDSFTAPIAGLVKRNFKLAWQLSVFDELHQAQETPCHPVQLVEPSYGQLRNIESVDIDFASLCSAYLKPTLITTACDRPIWDYGMGKRFRIRYGTSMKLDNNPPNTVLFDGGTYFVLKQNLDTIDGIAKYVREPPILVDNKGRALNQFFDSNLPLGDDAVAWGYMFYNGYDYTQTPKPASVKLKMNAAQIDANGAIIGGITTKELVVEDLNSSRMGVAAFPIGMANLGLTKQPTAVKLAFNFFVEGTYSGGDTYETALFNHEYRLCNCDDKHLEVYFLSRTGAIETITFEREYSVEQGVTQQEYKTARIGRNFLPPTKLVEDKLDRQRIGGTTQYQSEGTRTIKVTLKARPTPALMDFLESFTLSTLRYLRTKYEKNYGILNVEPITLNHSAYSTHKTTGLLTFEAELVIDSTNLL